MRKSKRQRRTSLRRLDTFQGSVMPEHFAPNNSDSPASSEALGAVEPVSTGAAFIFF
jgi:hypothetical protein